MKTAHFNSLIIGISLALVGLLSLQIYWNYKNYKQAEAVIHKDMTRLFDQVMKNYFELEIKKKERKQVVKNEKSVIFIQKADGTKIKREYNYTPDKNDEYKKMFDSTFINKLKNIFVEMRFADSLNLRKIDSLTKTTFKENNYDLKFKIFEDHWKFEKLKADTLHIVKYDISKKNKAKGLFLKYEAPYKQIWQKSAFEFIVSLIITLFLITGFIMLFKIIQKQKKIDAIKNDFISNMSHELKTPITVVGTALESIKHFYDNQDHDRTNRYLNMAAHHNRKLGAIVEKILDTSALDNNQLRLELETTNVSAFVQNFLNNNDLQFEHQTLETDIKANLFAKIDTFHFDNVLQNLFDNAQKYGGSTIIFRLFSNQNQLILEVEDSGLMDKKFADAIFDKFYRIPKGNIHKVKGYGIGLYYAKKVIEKHEGDIQLIQGPQTIFQIKLPLINEI